MQLLAARTPRCGHTLCCSNQSTLSPLQEQHHLPDSLFKAFLRPVGCTGTLGPTTLPAGTHHPAQQLTLLHQESLLGDHKPPLIPTKMQPQEQSSHRILNTFYTKEGAGRAAVQLPSPAPAACTKQLHQGAHDGNAKRVSGELQRQRCPCFPGSPEK